MGGDQRVLKRWPEGTEKVGAENVDTEKGAVCALNYLITTFSNL